MSTFIGLKINKEPKTIKENKSPKEPKTSKENKE